MENQTKTLGNIIYVLHMQKNARKWACMIYKMLLVVGFFGQSGRLWFQETQLCLNCFNIFIRRLYP